MPITTSHFSLRNLVILLLNYTIWVSTLGTFCLARFYLVGGSDLVHKAGLGRHCLEWLGDRPDLITIGVSKPRVSSNWKDSEKEIFQYEIKKAVATIVEISVNAVMGTHIYTFAGRFFVQRDYGPIGLRIMASLASLIMKIWDVLWLQLLKREGISSIDFFRYVDDTRSFLRPLLEGLRWNGQ